VPLTVAQVTPFAWEAPHEVNAYVGGLASELARRGHRVLVIAPTHSSDLAHDTRRAIRAARENPEALFDADGGVRVLGVGEVVPFSARGRRAASVPIDVARTLEEALAVAPLDVVHVHEPFAPSVPSAALRHSRALNVGTFHAPTERVLATQLARRMVERLLGRLDVRTASYAATRDLVARFFPGEYRVVLPAVDPPKGPGPFGLPPVTYAYLADEERPALRLLLRALRRLPEDLDWSARVWSPRETVPEGGIGRHVRERLTFAGPAEMDRTTALAGAEIAISASDGLGPSPDGVLRAIAAGAVPLAARLAVYEEIVGDGERGLLFEPGDPDGLAAQLQRLAADGVLRERLRADAAPLRERLTWSRLADDFEAIYAEVLGRRHDRRVTTNAVAARLRERPLIDVDLHMHTDHSADCATPVEVLLATAKARGLGAIAITDHNEISGALDAEAKADGIKVIVAEEVKTADQGEVIGLFIREKIPRGMTLQETIAEIRRQGGLVYVPHPFDRMHSVPDYEHLLAVIEDIDAIEVFNPRVAISEYNEEAVRFAAKYRIPAGAGSDAHVPQGLGSVRIRMRDFDGAEEFLASLREADIIRRPASLLLVQALKFLQTKATPAPARRAARERRVRRAVRKP
jgi:predicted metal-dependent phosphoesterase TrpH/glycosyltransferase involved in cell wall biosynthesis